MGTRRKWVILLSNHGIMLIILLSNHGIMLIKYHSVRFFGGHQFLRATIDTMLVWRKS